MAPGPGENEIAQDAAKKASQVESGMEYQSGFVDMGYR